MLNSVKKLQSRGEAETGTVRPLVVIFVFFLARKIRNTNIEARNKYKIPILNDQNSRP
jgi:hypothetical protein